MTSLVTARERTVLVTGSSSGIGRALATRLAATGATIGIVARDKLRADTVRDEISAATDNGAVRAFGADLSSQSDVRRLAAEVLRACSRLDALIHCAAVFTPRKTLTVDGLETMFATNHLAPFLLTGLLRELLVESGPARILTLTAPSTVQLDFEDLQAERSYRALTRFGASKAANLIFTFELARRLEGTRAIANAVHPGLARTSLMRDSPAPLRWATWIVAAPPTKVAAGVAPLALAPEFDGLSGRFYKGGREIDAPRYTRDPDVGARLWDVSATLTTLSEGVTQ